MKLVVLQRGATVADTAPALSSANSSAFPEKIDD
jgi:hypothetical protein